MPAQSLSRRRFMRNGGGALSIACLHRNRNVLNAAARPTASANGQMEIGLIGVGVRGKYLLANLPDTVTVTALCDCALSQMDAARNPKGIFAEPLQRFASGDARRCRLYQDYRKMLEKQSFDAIVIAAPDHHHASAAVRAMAHGSHVYIEKPLAVTIKEGRAIVDASLKYQRIVQVGSQQRTMQVNRRACEFLRDGGLGRIHRVDERNFPGPTPYPSDLGTETKPDDIAWDLFCGPTPLRPYHRKLWVKDAFKEGYLTWRGWDLFRDYSGHLMTNWGAHSIDMIQYALGMDHTGPQEIVPLPWPDPSDLARLDDPWHEKTPPLGAVPDRTLDRRRFREIRMTYAAGTEVRFGAGIRRTTFHGEQGKLFLSRNHYATDPPGLLPPIEPQEKAAWAGSGHVARPHLENWLAAIESGSPINAPPEVGHRTATICHLANIARELGRPLRWDPVQEEFPDDETANAQLGRERRRGFEL